LVNAANWSNGVPVDGDSVVLLRHPTSSFVNAVNDLTNLTLASIRCEFARLRSRRQQTIPGRRHHGRRPRSLRHLNISAPLEILVRPRRS